MAAGEQVAQFAVEQATQTPDVPAVASVYPDAHYPVGQIESPVIPAVAVVALPTLQLTGQV